MKIEQIETTILKTNNLQPSDRTSDNALRGLFNSIKSEGILVPLLVAGDMTVLDGHRRLASARKLGMQSVPCIIAANCNHSESFFVKANAHTRTLKTKFYLSAYLSGVTNDIPQKILKVMFDVVGKYGKRAIKLLQKNNVSPFYIQRLSYALDNLGLGNDYPVVEWCVKRKQLSNLLLYERGMINFTARHVRESAQKNLEAIEVDGILLIQTRKKYVR